MTLQAMIVGCSYRAYAALKNRRVGSVPQTLRFARDLWHFTNVLWLIDWLMGRGLRAPSSRTPPRLSGLGLRLRVSASLRASFGRLPQQSSFSPMLKRLYGHYLSFLSNIAVTKLQELPWRGIKYTGVGNICNYRPKSVRDRWHRSMVTVSPRSTGNNGSRSIWPILCRVGR